MNEHNEKVKVSGYLYVLTNESMEGILKIGYTLKRNGQISRTLKF